MKVAWLIRMAIVMATVFTGSVTESLAQVGGVGGRPGAGIGVGSGIGIGGRGVGGPGAAGLRSGIGVRNSPVVNPSPSLTPHEVLNPRGSLSSGQVLRPAPSLNRPRSGGQVPGSNRAGIRLPVETGKRKSKPHGGKRDSFHRSAERRIPATTDAQRLRSAAASLTSQLEGVPSHEEWEARLSLGELSRLDASTNFPVSDDTRQEWDAVLKQWESIATDKNASQVTALKAFAPTLDALRYFLTPIDQRRRDELAVAYETFDKELRGFKNGAAWAEFLALPDGLIDGAGSPETGPMAEKLLNRFDKLSGNPAYSKLTGLASFSPTHDALRRVVDRPEPDADSGNEAGPSTGQ